MDQMILDCKRLGTVFIIHCISVISVVMNLVQVKENVFSMIANILNK